MHENDLLSWIKKNNFFFIIKNHASHFKYVLKKSLNAKNEDLLIIGDYGSSNKRVAPLLAASYLIAAKNIGLRTKVVMQKSKLRTDSADNAAIQSLKNLKIGSLVVMCVSNRLGQLGNIGRSYRGFVREKKHRFVSTTGVGELRTEHYYSITQSINIKHAKIKKAGLMIKEALDKGRFVRVTTSAGTDITFNITGQSAILLDGDYSAIGHGGNVPFGEVYIAPKGNLVEGVVVIDGSSRNRDGTILVKKPIKLLVENGIATSIKGGKEASLLKETIAWAEKKAKHPSSVRMVSELGIGLNPMAGVIGCMIVDEKSLGSAHIALGSNYWFGGDIFTFIHLDQLFKHPRFFVDGKELKTPNRLSFF